MKKYLSSYWIRSAFYTFLQRFSITFFGFVNYAILTRYLSPSQLGTWGLFLIITGIFESAKSNLLKNAHIRYVSVTNSNDEKITIASSSFLINASISCLFILLILVFANWLGVWFNTGPDLALMLIWFIPGLVFMIFFAHLEAVQQSNLDFRGGFAGYLVRQLSFFCIILSYRLLRIPLTLPLLAMYQALTVGLGALILFVYTRKYLAFQFRASKLWVKRIFNYGGYIFSSGMVATISSSVDQFMIAKLLNTGAVAYYNVASRINLLVDIPSFAASEIIFPKASHASVNEGKDRVKYLFEKIVSVLIAVTLPVAIGIVIFPRLVTIIIAGHLYIAAAPILQLYMVSGVLRPAQNQAANLLNSIGKTKLVFLMNTGFLVLLLILNYICLKQFGFYGAALGTMITSLLNFIAWYFLMRKELNFSLATTLHYSIETYKGIFGRLRSLFKH